MTIRLNVVDREGREHRISALPNGVLMEVLRDYGVMAICGGMCSCATFHVYIDPQWYAQLAEPHGDERDLLSVLAHVTQHSRLACQVQSGRSKHKGNEGRSCASLSPCCLLIY